MSLVPLAPPPPDYQQGWMYLAWKRIVAVVLSFTEEAVGFTISGGTTSKTLTVPLDATVSGTNTGDNPGVTSIAVTGANGIGVSGSPITSSGTIGLSLGAITPTSVSTPTILGGSGVGSILELRSTSGAGNTDYIKATVGNNGATEVWRATNAGKLLVGTTTEIANGRLQFSGNGAANGIAWTNGTANLYQKSTSVLTTDASTFDMGGTLTAKRFGNNNTSNSGYGFNGEYCTLNTNGVQFFDFATILSAVTSTYSSFDSIPSTAASSFTLGALRHFRARDNAKGAGSAVTTQIGFDCAALTFGSTIYAFKGAVASGANKFNLFLDGTAQNHIAGDTYFGGISAQTLGTSNKLQVQGTTAATNSLGISAWSADALGSRIELGKSRGAAVGTNTIVQNNDVVASVTGYGANGSTFTNLASISMEVDGTPGATNDMPGRIVFSTTPDASGTLAEAVRISQDKSVTFSGPIKLASVALSPTAPTIASGFGTTPSIASSNGTAAFTVNVGTGGTASAGVITMPTAANGWVVHVENITATAANRADQRTVQTASTTTSVTVQNQTVSTGAALAWTASDILVITAVAY